MSCVIVLGCFRSGTSAVAGVLHHLGVYMGSEFDPPSPNNVQGYWEDLQFKRIHQQMNWGISDQAQIDFEYEELVRNREANHQLWGLKDPLLCLFVSKFVSLLQCDHQLIACKRPTSEIADSLSRAMDLAQPNGLFDLATYYQKGMELALECYKGPVLEVNYADIKSAREREIERIANFVKLPVTQAAIDHVLV